MSIWASEIPPVASEAYSESRDTSRTMSQENAGSDRCAQVEAVIAALDARDFDALADMPFHPGMEFRSALAAAEGAVYYGIRGLREWAKNVDSAFDDFRIGLIEFREIGDERALVVSSNRGIAKASGVPIDEQRCMIWTWRNGLIRRNDVYREGREALEAVGLSE